MAESTKVTIEGLDPILAKLATMKEDMQDKALKSAVRGGASLIARNARKNAPELTGALKKNIRVQYAKKTSERTGDVMYRVGVRGGARSVKTYTFKTRFSSKGRTKTTGSDTFYWRFLEFGTAKMRAKPFLRKAMEESSTKILGDFTSRLSKAIDRYARGQDGGET